jgi:ribonucleoside-diphosphate reductase alpha chain
MAWIRGLKTTYYLRALGATSTEKSTLDRGKLNAVTVGQDASQTSAEAPTAGAAPVEPPNLDLSSAPADVPLACSLDDPDCEACQ